MKKWALLPSLPTRAVVLAEAAQVQLVIFKPVVFNGTYIINTLVKLLKIYLFYSIILTYVIMHLASSYLS